VNFVVVSLVYIYKHSELHANCTHEMDHVNFDRVGLGVALTANAVSLVLLHRQVSELVQRADNVANTRLDVVAEIFLKTLHADGDSDTKLEKPFEDILFNVVKKLPLITYPETENTSAGSEELWTDMRAKNEPTVGTMLMHIISHDKIFNKINRDAAIGLWTQLTMRSALRSQNF
jgi:hypothetical protein